ncbi:MAG UNVERIFIED_CONTAM: hypothetical protein LVR29_02875 [Microcystis novacekii LVE1205-3]
MRWKVSQKRRLLQSLAFDEVDYVSPIYLDFAQWKNPNTRNYWRNIFVLGINLRISRTQLIWN